MDTQTLLILVGIFAVAIVIALVIRRRRVAAARPAEPPPVEGTLDMATEVRDGTTIAALPAPPEGPTPWHRRRLVRTALVAALVFGGLTGLWVGYSAWAARSPDSFVVMVAPFSDGGDGQTGRNVANALVRQLAEATGGAITVVLAPAAPHDARGGPGHGDRRGQRPADLGRGRAGGDPR